MADINKEELRKNIPALPELQSIEITEAGEGQVSYTFTPGPECANYHGDVHGGIVYTLCEIAAGMAATTLGKNNVALTGNINYLRRCALGEQASVHCTTAHAGRSTGVHHVRIENPQGKTIAEATFTLFVLAD